MIGRIGERWSGISVLAARHDDDDDDLMNASPIKISSLIKWLVVLLLYLKLHCNFDIKYSYLIQIICTQL